MIHDYASLRTLSRSNSPLTKRRNPNCIPSVLSLRLNLYSSETETHPSISYSDLQAPYKDPFTGVFYHDIHAVKIQGNLPRKVRDMFGVRKVVVGETGWERRIAQC